MCNYGINSHTKSKFLWNLIESNLVRITRQQWREIIMHCVFGPLDYVVDFTLTGFQALNAITLWQQLRYRAANWISFSEIKSIFHPSPTSQKTPWENSREFLFTITATLTFTHAHAQLTFVLSLEMALALFAYFSWYSEIIWRTQG